MTMYRLPTGANWFTLPIRGTIIAVLLQRSFSDAPGWMWGVMWTFMGILWVLSVIDIVTREHIPDAKWRQVFGEPK